MGKNCGSWTHQQDSALQSPFQNCRSPPLGSGLENSFPVYANPQTGMASANDNLPLPGFGFPELGNLKTAQPIEPPGWFYCLPRHRQAAFALPDCVAKEKFSTFPYGCFGQAAASPGADPASVQKQFHQQAAFDPLDCIAKEKFSAFPDGFFGQAVATPTAEPGSVQKQFLVFDHSGNQTSFFISSVIAPTIPFQHRSKIPRQFDAKGIYEELSAANRDPIYQSGYVVSDGLDENQESDDRSEMHEDTEELNALLYSDDEYEDTDGGEEDDEVASTGRSPSEMTGHEKEEEEVASSGGPTKKRKLLDGEHEATCSVMDTASSAKPKGSALEYVDDAESSCTKGRTHGREMGESPLGKKWLRKEKIRETVSILQSIIPGVKGKDAALILDEAIQYLRSLKVKAKALGTSTTTLN
ncbi:transcription factor SAC51-like [Macadamia integrifolia]|uniref:transcription factor SAC51-like n=1 Tax=Macadamia integrifolia TaxID=60698 RepID=UPI001C4F6A91|nr:transcription factor SAC51-like [Macadamia integrifolia]